MRHNHFNTAVILNDTVSDSQIREGIGNAGSKETSSYLAGSAIHARATKDVSIAAFLSLTNLQNGQAHDMWNANTLLFNNYILMYLISWCYKC